MLAGKHYQNAYVVADIDKGLEYFRALRDLGDIQIIEATTPVITPVGQREQSIKLALFWVDDLQYEVIEPVGGHVDLYAAAIRDDGIPAFHHSCTRVDDWEALRNKAIATGFDIAIEGGGDHLKFLYLDARPAVGHYLEYCWMNDDTWLLLGGSA